MEASWEMSAAWSEGPIALGPVVVDSYGIHATLVYGSIPPRNSFPWTCVLHMPFAIHH
jgi:hypothetical protein